MAQFTDTVSDSSSHESSSSGASTSSDVGNNSTNPQVSWPVARPTQSTVWSPGLDSRIRAANTDAAQPSPPMTIPLTELLPSAPRSQVGIGTRSFLLGFTLGTSILLAIYLAYIQETRFWRPAFFLAALSLFHFLEFWTHAMYNVPNARVSTFLLFSNGMAYTLAHTFAMLETLITSTFLPSWQDRFSLLPVQLLGVLLVILGQTVRTGAMATAGTNFHHHVQTKHNQGHVLVTNGIYAFLRHPSYFGFFYWAVGTQLVLGNFLSFWVYLGVLWRFFAVRIRSEEKHLVKFFGEDYVQYRARSRVGIPFIR